MLISIANYTDKAQSCHLNINWAALNLSPDGVSAEIPEITDDKVKGRLGLSSKLRSEVMFSFEDERKPGPALGIQGIVVRARNECGERRGTNDGCGRQRALQPGWFATWRIQSLRGWRSELRSVRE